MQLLPLPDEVLTYLNSHPFALRLPEHLERMAELVLEQNAEIKASEPLPESPKAAVYVPRVVPDVASRKDNHIRRSDFKS